MPVQAENYLELTNQEVKVVNRLVGPFVQQEWNKGHPTATGGTDRGVVITMQDATKILVRVYRHGEPIPKVSLPEQPRSHFPILVYYKGDRNTTLVASPEELKSGHSFRVLETRYSDQ